MKQGNKNRTRQIKLKQGRPVISQKKSGIGFNSGFITLFPYSHLSEKKKFLKKEVSTGSLLESLQILIKYIDGLSRIESGVSYHDMHLQVLLDIKRTEMSDLLPRSCIDNFQLVWGSLFFIYKTVVNILYKCLELQNQFYIDRGASEYVELLDIEKKCITELHEYICNFVTNNILDTRFESRFFESSSDFRNCLLELESGEKRGSVSASSSFRILGNISENNFRLYKRITTIKKEQ